MLVKAGHRLRFRLSGSRLKVIFCTDFVVCGACVSTAAMYSRMDVSTAAMHSRTHKSTKRAATIPDVAVSSCL